MRRSSGIRHQFHAPPNDRQDSRSFFPSPGEQKEVGPLEVTVARPRKTFFAGARACVRVYVVLGFLSPRIFTLERPADPARTRKRRGGVLAGTWPPLQGIRISIVPSPRHFENGQAGTAIDIADGASREGDLENVGAPLVLSEDEALRPAGVAAKSDLVSELRRHTFRGSCSHRARPNELAIPPRNRPVVTPS